MVLLMSPSLSSSRDSPTRIPALLISMYTCPTSLCTLKIKVCNIQSTLPKSNLHKPNNRLSRRSFQVLFSLFSMFLTPHKSNFL